MVDPPRLIGLMALSLKAQWFPHGIPHEVEHPLAHWLSDRQAIRWGSGEQRMIFWTSEMLLALSLTNWEASLRSTQCGFWPSIIWELSVANICQLHSFSAKWPSEGSPRSCTNTVNISVASPKLLHLGPSNITSIDTDSYAIVKALFTPSTQPTAKQRCLGAKWW